MVKITDLYGSLYLMELSMSRCEAIHSIGANSIANTVDMNRFKSAELQRAFNHLQSARMYAGSIARIFGKVTPYTASFKGELKQEKNEVLDPITDAINLDAIGDGGEVAAICEIRKVLAHHPEKAGCFYDTLLMVDNWVGAGAKMEGCNVYELKFHIHNLLTNIQDCTNILGIHFGKLLAATK